MSSKEKEQFHPIDTFFEIVLEGRAPPLTPISNLDVLYVANTQHNLVAKSSVKSCLLFYGKLEQGNFLKTGC